MAGLGGWADARVGRRWGHMRISVVGATGSERYGEDQSDRTQCTFHVNSLGVDSMLPARPLRRFTLQVPNWALKRTSHSESPWVEWRLPSLETRMESWNQHEVRERRGGIRSSSRSGAVRVVHQLRAETGQRQRMIIRVADQLGAGGIPRSAWLRPSVDRLTGYLTLKLEGYEK